MTLWFNDDGSTPGTPGDPSDPANLYEDSDCLVPHGAISTTSDDLTLLAAITAIAQNFACHDLIGGGFSVSTNIGTQITGAASNLTWAAGITSAPTSWTGVTFNTDPGSTLHGVDCTYNCAIATMGSDSGGTFGPFTFSGNFPLTSPLFTDSAATFPGTVTSNVDPAGGIFNVLKAPGATNCSVATFVATTSTIQFNVAAISTFTAPIQADSGVDLKRIVIRNSAGTAVLFDFTAPDPADVLSIGSGASYGEAGYTLSGTIILGGGSRAREQKTAMAIQQSTTSDPLTFFMVQTDGKTPKTGASPAVVLSKAGGSFASPGGAVSEIANGWYKVAGNATDTNTLGELALHATASGADPVDKTFQIVAYNPRAVAAGAAVAGNQMDLVNAPNATAIAAIQSGLALASALASVLTAVNAITTNTTRGKVIVPGTFIRPASGSSIVLVGVNLYDLSNVPQDADANTVTIHAKDSAGGSLDSHLSSTTMTRTAAGMYTATYTVNSSDTQGEVFLTATWAVSSVGMNTAAAAAIADAEALTTLAMLLTQTGSTAIASATQTGMTAQGFTSARAIKLDDLDATVSSAVTAANTAASNASTAATEATTAATQSTTAATQATAGATSAATAVTQTTAMAIAGAVLATPTQKIATDSSGKVTTSNPAIVRNVTVQEQ